MAGELDAPPGYNSSGVKIGSMVDAPPGFNAPKPAAEVDAPPGFSAQGVKVGDEVDAPPGMSGPKPTSTPHKYDSIMRDAAKGVGLDLGVLRAVGMQESGLGTSANYNPKTGTDRDGNKGNGLFQLDPSSGADAKTLGKAATDPTFAAGYAAKSLKDALRRTNGDLRGALSIYNSGKPDSDQGLAYADQVMSRMQSQDNPNFDPEIVQKMKHDAGVVTNQLKKGKSLDQALGKTRTLRPVRDIEARGAVSWQWVQDHPLDAAMNVLGAPQRALGGFEEDRANGMTREQALQHVHDYVFNPTDENNKKSTRGSTDALNAFFNQETGHKGNVIPSNEDISKYIYSRHLGAVAPIANGLANGVADFGRQMISDPTIIGGPLKTGLGLALHTASSISHVAHSIAVARGMGDAFSHLPAMRNIHNAVADVFVARRDLDKAGFTTQGKNLRLAIENSELARRTRNQQVDENVVTSGVDSSRRFLDYVYHNGDASHSAEAARLLGRTRNAAPTGHMVAGNIQSTLSSISAMSKEERGEFFAKARGLMSESAIRTRTIDMVQHDKTLFKGMVTSIGSLGLKDEGEIMKALDKIADKNKLGELAKKAIMWNPLPHGIKNVGTLAYLAGGLPAVMHGMTAMVKGISPADLKRLEDMGALPLYIDQAHTRWGQGMHSALERMEQGWRHGLLQTIDEKLGHSAPGSVQEMLKGQMVSSKIGDYRNQSAFVKMFQALGGPFVAFRLGIVPGQVAHALVHNPSRVTNYIRARQDVQNNRTKKGQRANEYILGGPTDDAAELATKPKKFLTSPSTLGPAAMLIPRAADQHQGLLSMGMDLASSYIPGFSAVSQAAKIVQGNAAPGQKQTWADDIVHAIMDMGAGGHTQKKETGKQAHTKQKRTYKGQTL
jgi:hypothetical protein